MGIEWMTGVRATTGLCFIATADGGRIDFNRDQIPALVSSLTELDETYDDLTVIRAAP